MVGVMTTQDQKTVSLLITAGICLATATAAAGEANTWLGKTTDWTESTNWSLGASPSGEKAQSVRIPATRSGTYPILTKGAAVGGSLTIAKGAQLSLQGHALQVGQAIPDASAKHGTGLTVENGACLLCGDGSPTITLHTGGLANHGVVSGKPALRIIGRSRGLRISGGSSLSLAQMSLGHSPFPYPVVLGGSVSVHGDLRLAGGKLIVKPSLDTQQTKFTVKGDLLFQGREPCVMLVTEADLLLEGTIKSEGSAFCVETPGSTPIWDQTEGAALCRPTGKEGWVWMVGAGDQEIDPGGILPPIGINKRSGKVTLSGDLHCTGLHLKSGNTLDRSKGQKLIFGHHLREWTTNPEQGAIPRHGPCRRSRDLINEGTLLGAPAVPVSFLLNVRGKRYVVDVLYQPPAPKSEATPAGMAGVGDASPWWCGPGVLSINRFQSRIQLKGDKLFLDGKPWEKSETEGKAAGTEEDAELDGLAGDLDDEAQPDAQPGAQAKARVLSLKLKTVDPQSRKPESSPFNIAPYVKEIVPSDRAPTIWAVNSLVWAWRDVYALVDGDAEVGYGGNTAFDFVFPEPVTVGAVRVRSRTSVSDTFQFAIYADTTGDGQCDKVLAWACGGKPLKGQSWMSWGTSGVAFPPQQLHRLRFRALGPGGGPSRPTLDEIEIYADQQSHDRLLEQDWIAQVPKFPDDARFLTFGKEVNVNWPEPAPDDRVHKIVTAAFWMFGIGWSTATRPDYWDKLPPLREHAPCTGTLDEMKNRYRFDAIKLFFEGEKTGVPWPSLNFKSATNAQYLAKRKAALAMRKALKQEKPGTEEEIGDLLDEEPEEDGMEVVPEVKAPKGDAKYSEELKLEDLPCQRNLMTELCDAAHERGMTVYVVCRPEDMSSRAIYIGPKDRDPYELFLRECVAGGADGVSLVADEEHLVWSVGNYPKWREFHAEWKDKRQHFTPTEHKRWVLSRDRLAAELLNQRKRSIQEVKPGCLFYTDGARMLHGGDPYDVIGHLVDVDYFGCHYQPHIVRRWVAATKNRKVHMADYVHRTVRYAIEAVLQGARLIGSYRFNYISEIAHSESHRIRENTFIDQFVRWGGTRPTRPPIAFLVSRASEAWWPTDCRNGPYPPDEAHRAWAVPEVMYDFLLKNGYTFDVYYLDQVEDLAVLKDYHLIVVPFAYSMPKAALEPFDRAYKAGAKFLICERKGEVDDVGQRYDRPLLEDFIKQGAQTGQVRFFGRDLLALQHKRSYLRETTALVDPLLGEHKDLFLKRYGNRIEGIVSAPRPDEQYVSLINWEDREARIEVGLNLPDGQYKLLTLSSDGPDAFRQGLVDGRATLSAKELQDFAVELNGDEVLSLYVIPAERTWGQR